MSTVLDYVGRTADLVAFQLVLPAIAGQEQLLTQSMVGPNDSGSLVTGIQKLVQRVLLALLTETGSKQYLPDDGCDFMIDARQGWWRTSADVMQSFYAARLVIARQITADEAVTDPPDERYAGMDLTGVVLTGDQITLRITLSSLAGTNYTFITPITVPLR